MVPEFRSHLNWATMYNRCTFSTGECTVQVHSGHKVAQIGSAQIGSVILFWAVRKVTFSRIMKLFTFMRHWAWMKRAKYE